MDISKCKCQEATAFGLVINGEIVPCGQPGAKVVFHQRDGRHVYVMCLPCADHNIKNRGGIELVEKQ